MPDETVRRRYLRGLVNFFRLYRPIADSWKVYDNANPKNPVTVAVGTGAKVTIRKEQSWTVMQKLAEGNNDGSD
ncbi:MAG: hypothetical protein HY040_03540 [Planctomycetes bacterium]|nr:hypothetical protein [Planctomycetota bacterium]